MRKGGGEKLAVLRACASVCWLSKGKCWRRRLRNAAVAVKGANGAEPESRELAGRGKQHQI